MDEVTLAADGLILTAILICFGWNRRQKEHLHDRVDDIVNGIGALAKELLDRTDQLRDIRMPDISLINQDPISNILRMIQQFKSGNFQDENITSHRDPSGRYAPALPFEEAETPTPETDILD